MKISVMIIESGSLKEIKNLLKTKKFDQDDLDKSLLIVCEIGKDKLIPLLIKKGAKPTTAQDQAWMWACINKKWKVAKELSKFYQLAELRTLSARLKKILDCYGEKSTEEKLAIIQGVKSLIEKITAEKITKSLTKHDIILDSLN